MMPSERRSVSLGATDTARTGFPSTAAESPHIKKHLS
jgi:hypothetical protein